jgi:hypothetical protein
LGDAERMREETEDEERRKNKERDNIVILPFFQSITRSRFTKRFIKTASFS